MAVQPRSSDLKCRAHESRPHDLRSSPLTGAPAPMHLSPSDLVFFLFLVIEFAVFAFSLEQSVGRNRRCDRENPGAPDGMFLRIFFGIFEEVTVQRGTDVVVRRIGRTETLPRVWFGGFLSAD